MPAVHVAAVVAFDVALVAAKGARAAAASAASSSAVMVARTVPWAQMRSALGSWRSASCDQA